MMVLYPVPLIWDSPVYPSVLHNVFIKAGIPYFTPEIGPARRLDLDMIHLFDDGTLNILKHYGVIPGPIGRTAFDANVMIGKTVYPVVGSQGGFIEWLLKTTDNVRAGQKLAIQRNAFGEVLAEYTSPVQGRIAGLRSDATSEPGNVLVFILSTSAPGSEAAPYAESL